MVTSVNITHFNKRIALEEKHSTCVQRNKSSQKELNKY